VITIPDNILSIAKTEGVTAMPVVRWVEDQLAAAGLASDASPAEWPAALWDAYLQLKGETDAVETNARGLFNKLNIPG
jgi:hypothetical protein